MKARLECGTMGITRIRWASSGRMAVKKPQCLSWLSDVGLEGLQSVSWMGPTPPGMSNTIVTVTVHEL